MSPALVLLIAELIKLALQRIQEAGKFDTLTEAEAKAIAKEIGATLATKLPSPADLEG